MATILRASGKREELPISVVTLEVLQREVQGYVERLECRDSANKVTHILYVNDEARLMGMPFNQDASSAIRMSILGDAILMTKEEELEWQR